MKLVLENIGMLKQAELSLVPLTVIAGENDNGKSTVGKIVFCIIKAINRYKEDLRESKEHLIGEKFDEIFFQLRAGLSAANSDAFEILRGMRVSLRLRMNTMEQLHSLDEVMQQAFAVPEFSPSAKLSLQALREELQVIWDEPENINQSIQNALNKVFASEFDGSLLLQGATDGRIQLLEGDRTLIDLVVTRKGVRLVGEVEPIELTDVTFIDSPLIFNNHDLLVRSQTLLDMGQKRSGRLGLPFTALHTKDLFDKLCTPVLSFDLFSQDGTGLSSSIQEIVDGEIAYDRKDRDFVFRRRGESISIKNTASGIKVFGLLQILVGNEFVTKNTMLIFDEPENHLHPKWQLKLARVLIALVQNGVHVLVSSHSPYLIEALKREVDRKGLDADARFALAQEKTIVDKNRLGEIFEALSAPFEEFSRMDAEDLRDE